MYSIVHEDVATDVISINHPAGPGCTAGPLLPEHTQGQDRCVLRLLSRKTVDEDTVEYKAKHTPLPKALLQANCQCRPPDPIPCCACLSIVEPFLDHVPHVAELG